MPAEHCGTRAGVTALWAACVAIVAATPIAGALSVLVITKLPFDVPSDPIVEARSESFDDPFNEYMLPEAILRFRQGFGRLIRTQTDRGVVAILDKRILSKQYGRLFMESLPDCTVIEGSLANLPEKAASWLGS